MTSRVGAVARLLILDVLGSVAWFPVWWYSTGLLSVLHATQSALDYRIRSYAFAIWIRNFFVPMYGQHDLTGRLVSVVMRFVVLVARAIALAVEALVYGCGIVLWILAPMGFILLAMMSVARGMSGRL
jgi:hypothetical protein